MSPCIILYSLIFSVVCSQDIIYEKDTDSCKLPGGGSGICTEHGLCPEAYDNFPRVKPTICGFNGIQPVVCCPIRIGPVTEDPNNPIPFEDISAPAVDFDCGHTSIDEIRRFPQGCPQCGVGGEPARFLLVKYSVLVGFQAPTVGQKIDWFCTGVLINHQWVLTAAHCIVQRQVNVVRLGEHDYNDQNDGFSPVTLNVTSELLYPEFTHPQGYHDLALLKVERHIEFGRFINPVCLPWGDGSKRSLINEKISLTGWGATEFGGTGSSILQEVNVTVFSTSVCDSSYSSLKDYPLVWPKGLGEETLCAGDPQGGKDACQGDSGGPVTYLNSGKRYTLAGVVSRGYGCGLKDFPGLYANIHHPPYLVWIKKVAFQ